MARCVRVPLARLPAFTSLSRAHGMRCMHERAARASITKGGMAAVSLDPCRGAGKASSTPDQAVVDALVSRLSVALGLAELLLDEPHLSSQAHLDLTTLVDELASAGELVKQMQRERRLRGSAAEPP